MDVSSDGPRIARDSEWTRRSCSCARYPAGVEGAFITQGVDSGIIILAFIQEVTLTPQTDPFFLAHHLATFGDLGTSLKSYVQSYQSRSLAQGPQNINSISDMKRFVEEYPEFRRLGGNVSKHVAIVGELSRVVERDKLLELGEVEQGLATGSGADLRVSEILNVVDGG